MCRCDRAAHSYARLSQLTFGLQGFVVDFLSTSDVLHWPAVAHKALSDIVASLLGYGQVLDKRGS